jgi:hypothetical protein
MTYLGGTYVGWIPGDYIELSESEYQIEVKNHKCDLQQRWEKEPITLRPYTA